MGSKVKYVLVSWAIVSWGCKVNADAPPTNFVVGFDRFARHKEVEEKVGGRLLLTELSCTACHADNSKQLAPKGGPRLNGAGNRLQAPWIKQFLSSTQVTKPGTTMPDMFAV
ncbi:MAG: hypothetical protein KDA84_02390, partial [Planctomycetaceae bacterium]|nr:hypothetical protein [Planctomycetaceae bacterium]